MWTITTTQNDNIILSATIGTMVLDNDEAIKITK